jgi:tripartite-type tricarboxylate transporter receptor subunit TctC
MRFRPFALFRLLGAALLLASCCSGALAQNYPSKPIRMILAFPASGPSDILGRALGQKLSEQMSENFIPDNRPGAGGNLGIAVAAKSAADGYTIVLVSPTISISPSLYAQLSYDAARDLTPIARLASIQNVLLVHPSVPAKTLKQFIALARSQPGKLNYGSGGAGTTNHLANVLLESLANIKLVHVPYKGATQAMVSMIGGEVDEVVVAVSPALAQIRAGRLRALAVLSEQRVPALPEVPTAKEAGLDNFVMPIWYGMLAPAGTPPDIVARLHREIARALAAPDLRERLAASGIDPWPGTPQQLAELIRDETVRYGDIIRRAGLRVE